MEYRSSRERNNMPLYDYVCQKCGKSDEMYLSLEHQKPTCCGADMRMLYSSQVHIRIKYPLWVDRMDDIHKAQEEKGERLRFVHPSEVLKA